MRRLMTIHDTLIGPHAFGGPLPDPIRRGRMLASALTQFQ